MDKPDAPTNSVEAIPPNDDREGVTVAEACRLSSLGRSRLYELMADGTIQSVTVGRRRIVLRRSLSELLRGGDRERPQRRRRQSAGGRDARPTA